MREMREGVKKHERYFSNLFTSVAVGQSGSQLVPQQSILGSHDSHMTSGEGHMTTTHIGSCLQSSTEAVHCLVKLV